MGGTGCPLGNTFFLHCQTRHSELLKLSTYLPVHAHPETNTPVHLSVVTVTVLLCALSPQKQQYQASPLQYNTVSEKLSNAIPYRESFKRVLPLLLLAAGVAFLLLVFDYENVLSLKCSQFRITQGRNEQVEDKQDQSMKGCSQNELDKERYQQ